MVPAGILPSAKCCFHQSFARNVGAGVVAGVGWAVGLSVGLSPLSPSLYSAPSGL